MVKNDVSMPNCPLFRLGQNEPVVYVIENKNVLESHRASAASIHFVKVQGDNARLNGRTQNWNASPLKENLGNVHWKPLCPEVQEASGRSTDFCFLSGRPWVRVFLWPPSCQMGRGRQPLICCCLICWLGVRGWRLGLPLGIEHGEGLTC